MFQSSIQKLEVISLTHALQKLNLKKSEKIILTDIIFDYLNFAPGNFSYSLLSVDSFLEVINKINISYEKILRGELSPNTYINVES